MQLILVFLWMERLSVNLLHCNSHQWLSQTWDSSLLIWPNYTITSTLTSTTQSTVSHTMNLYLQLLINSNFLMKSTISTLILSFDSISLRDTSKPSKRWFLLLIPLMSRKLNFLLWTVRLQCNQEDSLMRQSQRKFSRLLMHTRH